MQSTSRPQISDLERPLGNPKETHARAKEKLEALAREGDLARDASRRCDW